MLFSRNSSPWKLLRRQYWPCEHAVTILSVYVDLRRALLLRGRGGVDPMRGVDKANLPSKVCETCQRPFTWRKVWEACWDEVSVGALPRLADALRQPGCMDQHAAACPASPCAQVKTCSDRCKNERKRKLNAANRAARIGPGGDGDDAPQQPRTP